MPMNDAYRQMLAPGTPQLPQSTPMQPMQTPMQPSGIGDYNQLPPEVLEMLLGTYGDQLELGGLDAQLLQAQALRDTPMPEGRSTGRVYTAANPLEHIGAGIKQFQGMRDARRIGDEQEELRRKIGEAVRTYGMNAPR